MNVINLEFRDEFNKYLNKIESFADYTLTFETNLKYLKSNLHLISRILATSSSNIIRPNQQKHPHKLCQLSH